MLSCWQADWQTNWQTNWTACADFPTGLAAPVRTAPDKTARKPPSTCTAVTPSPPAATQCSRLLLRASYGLQHTPRLSSFSFLSLVTLTFDPQIRTLRYFCIMHLTTKFHHSTFNRSEVIVRTNKLTNTQTDDAENIASLCYAGGNNTNRKIHSPDGRHDMQFHVTCSAIRWDILIIFIYKWLVENENNTEKLINQQILAKKGALTMLTSDAWLPKLIFM